MKLAVFTGSFDPVTLGHVDIMRRASGLFEELNVCVIGNPQKHAMFSVEDRMEMIRLAAEGACLNNVTVSSYNGMAAHYALSVGASYIVRGLRNQADFGYETNMETYNRMLAPMVETVYLSCPPELMHISSSGVRELIHYGADIGTLVPDRINKYVSERLKNDE